MGPGIHMTVPCRPTREPAPTRDHALVRWLGRGTATVPLSYERSRAARPRSSARPSCATINIPSHAASHGRNESAQDRRHTPSTTHTRARKRSSIEARRARTHTLHTTSREALHGVVVALGGRWPARKLGMGLEEREPHCCTCHLGGGGLYMTPTARPRHGLGSRAGQLKPLSDRPRSSLRPVCGVNRTSSCTARTVREDEAQDRRQTRSNSRDVGT